MSKGKLIAVDWGTTNRRAYLLDISGNIIDSKSDDRGLLAIRNGDYEKEFYTLVSSWMSDENELPTLLSGMIGASTGWKETEYCSLPTGVNSLASNLVSVPSKSPIWIIPGVFTRDLINTPDVIRGEEVQAFASIQDSHLNDTLIVMPGTHSKWVKMQDGQIVDFRTYMTGDLHAAILNHTIVSKLVSGPAEHNTEVFLRAVETGYDYSDDLTHIIFGSRSKVLFDELDSANINSHLSGLLIGAEIKSALSVFEDFNNPIHFIASPVLEDL